MIGAIGKLLGGAKRLGKKVIAAESGANELEMAKIDSKVKIRKAGYEAKVALKNAETKAIENLSDIDEINARRWNPAKSSILFVFTGIPMLAFLFVFCIGIAVAIRVSAEEGMRVFISGLKDLVGIVVLLPYEVIAVWCLVIIGVTGLSTFAVRAMKIALNRKGDFSIGKRIDSARQYVAKKVEPTKKPAQEKTETPETETPAPASTSKRYIRKITTDREIDKVVVHCSDTDLPEHDNVKIIRKWHTDSEEDGGNGWDDIGYHIVITKDGEVRSGRDINEIPAAQAGYNTGSIAICLTGRNRFSQAQFASLKELLTACFSVHSGAKLYGHNELNSGKTCPNFDVHELYKR